MPRKTYILENLGCANCAAKMEAKISALPQVQEATLTFATKQLRVTAEDPDALLPEMQKIVSQIESEVKIVDPETAHGHSEHHHHDHKHHHHDGCDCCHDDDDDDDEEEEHDSPLGLIVGGALFLIGLLLDFLNVRILNLPLSAAVFVLAYGVLGLEILMTAGRNLIRGRVFDENFLMSVATLGAFAIGEFPEAVGVMLFYRVGEFFEHKAVERSRSQIMEAVDLRPEVVHRVTSGGPEEIPAEEARIGDVLLVRPGDRIPLDGVVVTGSSRLDTAPITGESVPVQVQEGDAVISGCVNLAGRLTVRVEKPLSESMVTRILNAVENAAAGKPKMDRFITRFARVYTPVVVGAAVLVAVVPSLITGNWNYWVKTALTFLVMSCPCALVLSVPLAFFSGIGAGSKRGILFKGGLSIEALAGVRAVAMDKTGTVTKGDFRVQKEAGRSDVLAVCAACEQYSTHPIAVSVVTAAKEKGLTLEKPEALEEIAGHGIRCRLNGKTVLCGNTRLMELGRVDLKGFVPEAGGSTVLVAEDGELIGYLVISDTLKPGAGEAVRRLRAMGVQTAMLTGDTEENARAVAAAVGIGELHARLLPEEKLERLQTLRQKHGSTMFVGDGINDAPVLAGADVGAAMGSGADAAIEAADVVYMTSDVGAIPESIAIAGRTKSVAWQNVAFALAVKLAVMALGLAGFASMWMAVFADSGVALLCVLNSIRVLYEK